MGHGYGEAGLQPGGEACVSVPRRAPPAPWNGERASVPAATARGGAVRLQSGQTGMFAGVSLPNVCAEQCQPPEPVPHRWCSCSSGIRRRQLPARWRAKRAEPTGRPRRLEQQHGYSRVCSVIKLCSSVASTGEQINCPLDLWAFSCIQSRLQSLFPHAGLRLCFLTSTNCPLVPEGFPSTQT